MQAHRVFIASCMAVVLLGQAFAEGLKAKAQPAAKRHAATSSLEFRVKDGKEHTITRNRRFTVTYLCFADRTCSDLVLQETFFHDQEEGAEGGPSEVSVTTWKKETPGDILWKITQAGEEGKLLLDFYEVTWFGCCGDWNVKTYFSPETGKKIYTSAENDLLKIEVPNARTRRYIAYNSPSGEDKPGVLQYGDDEHVMQKVLVRQTGYEQPPQMALHQAGKPNEKTVTVWSRNDQSSAAVSGVEIVMRFEAGEVVIPIENDGLVVEKARMPDGFKLRRAEITNPRPRTDR